jgi:hypothetical protein
VAEMASITSAAVRPFGSIAVVRNDHPKELPVVETEQNFPHRVAVR